MLSDDEEITVRNPYSKTGATAVRSSKRSRTSRHGEAQSAALEAIREAHKTGRVRRRDVWLLSMIYRIFWKTLKFLSTSLAVDLCQTKDFLILIFRSVLCKNLFMKRLMRMNTRKLFEKDKRMILSSMMVDLPYLLLA